MGIPLTPTLVNPPPSTLDQAAKLTNLRGLMQQQQYYPQEQDAKLAQETATTEGIGLENQQKKAELGAQEAGKDALRTLSQRRAQLDPKEQSSADGNFYNDLADELQKDPRALPQQIQGLRTAGVDYATKLGTANKDQIENLGKFHDTLDDNIADLQKIKDPVKQAALYQQKLPGWVQQASSVDPNFGRYLQSHPYEGPESLDDLKTVNGAFSHSASEAKTAQDAAEAAARAHSEGFKFEGGAVYDTTGDTPKLIPPEKMGSIPAAGWDKIVDDITKDHSALATSAKPAINAMVTGGKIDDAYKAVEALRAKVADIEAETDPKVRASRAEQAAMVQAATEQGILDRQSRPVVEKNNLTYSKLASQLNTVKQTIQDAKNGSELASAMVPLEGVLALTGSAARGTPRLNTGLLDTFGGGVGSLGRRLDATLAKSGSGTLPKDTVKELSDFIDQYQKIAYDNYLGEMDSTAGTYLSKENHGKVPVFSVDGKKTVTLDKAQKDNAPAPTAADLLGKIKPGVSSSSIEDTLGSKYAPK